MSLFWPEFSAALRRKYPLRSNYWEGITNLPSQTRSMQIKECVPAAFCKLY